MLRKVLLCLFLTLTGTAAGRGLAQNAAPIPDAAIAADRAKSNALTAVQHEQAQKLFATAFGLLQSGDAEAAKLGFERGLAIDPANSTANFYLAELLVRLGDNAGARSHYGKVVALDPDSAEGLRAQAALNTLPASVSAEKRALKAGDSFKDCAECPEMIVVPAGAFTMGSPWSESGRDADEDPQHMVTFARQFAVGKFVVTFDEWDACVADGGCNGYRPSDQGWGRGRRPVINVSWDDAKAYVAWLSRKSGKTYRLLSEAEYEYAARAGTTSAYVWSDAVGKTAPVDSFAANGFGLYDMAGNVFTWTEDCYHSSYDLAPTDGSAWTGRDCLRVLRGGSWGFNPREIRFATRLRSVPDYRSDGIGLRIGQTLVTSQ